jgi:hypothetical protein
MDTRVTKLTGKSEQFWRSAIGLIVTYAFTIQSLFAGFAGLALPSHTEEGLPAFELCLNGAHEAPGSPAGLPGDASGSHCILCFAGSPDFLGAPPPYRFHPVDIEIGSVHLPIGDRRLLSVNDYSIAQPRAPPLGA